MLGSHQRGRCGAQGGGGAITRQVLGDAIHG
jgi:hypothetical protein